MEIKPVGAEDLEQELDLRVRAFGPLGGYRERLTAGNLKLIEAGQLFGAYDGDRLIGSARYLEMRQWWHGREIPMAGVAGVKVAPEMRRRGVAAALLTELLALLTGRGFPISVLYPSAPGVYRSLGWEFGGGFYRTEVVGRALASLLPPESQPAGDDIRLRRAGPDDAEEAVATMSAVFAASLACGPTTFGVDDLRKDLAEDDQLAYLTNDGFLSYGVTSATQDPVAPPVTGLAS